MYNYVSITSEEPRSKEEFLAVAKSLILKHPGVQNWGIMSESDTKIYVIMSTEKESRGDFRANSAALFGMEPEDFTESVSEERL